ncbi:MAG TPA: flagellar hook-associated protein FlgK [Gammaproteobacteria bacterium]
MSGGIFGVGVSALLAAQRALQVTGHNIANVATEGYSRQRLELASREPATAGFGAVGRGVEVVGIRRVVNDFVNQSLNVHLSAEAEQRTLAEFAGRVNDMLADAQSGLAPALQRFFAAAEDVANDPTSTAARATLIAEAQSLVDRFADLEATLQSERAAASAELRTRVDEINQLTDGIAKLNQAIVDARGLGGEPSDLLDQRDQLVRRLAEHVAVHTVEQSDGSLNVYVGQGQALVVGFDAAPLAVRVVNGDPNDLAVGFERPGGFVDITARLSGGAVGALLDVRETVIEPTSLKLGRLAVALASVVNDVHRRGMDLEGELGEDFFGFTLPAPLAHPNNAATGTPAVTVADATGLVASDYELRFDGTAWQVRRLADGAVVATVANGGTAAFDGLSLDLAGVTGAAAGDRFLLRPLRVVPSLEVLVTEPRAVAAALPVRAEPAAANGGNAAVTEVTIVDPTDAALRAPVDIAFANGEFVVGTNVVPLDPSGETTIEANGWRVVIRGTPAEGDVFQVRDNAGAAGDNRGALALAAVASQRVLDNGTARLDDAYADVVAGVGVATRRAQVSHEAEARMLADAQARREAVSGVNLDEEAANMLRYQQAYQAAAQVIATAGTMIESLLAAFRR